MNGYTRDKLIGKSVDMILPEPTTPEERQAHLHLHQEKGVINIETMHRHRDGHIFPIEVSTSLVTLGGR